MVLTQLRHFKLWYAERAENWRLASYELEQPDRTVGRIVKLYPSAAAVSQGDLVREKSDPVLAELRRAVADRNRPRFEQAYARMTAVCNQCHEAADVGFVVARIPTKSPFGNQDFAPSCAFHGC